MAFNDDDDDDVKEEEEEEKTKERRRCKEKRGEIQHGVWKGRDGAEE